MQKEIEQSERYAKTWLIKLSNQSKEKEKKAGLQTKKIDKIQSKKIHKPFEQKEKEEKKIYKKSINTKNLK